tara:strand:+ start:108 stop:332 length:225 start_codon:yes stop_codon:yes gene_type:complete
MHQDTIQTVVIDGTTYRSFDGWRSWGFRIKKGEKSHMHHLKFGPMFSSSQVWNPVNSSRSVGRDLNALSERGWV